MARLSTSNTFVKVSLKIPNINNSQLTIALDVKKAAFAFITYSDESGPPKAIAAEVNFFNDVQVYEFLTCIAAQSLV